MQPMEPPIALRPSLGMPFEGVTADPPRMRKKHSDVAAGIGERRFGIRSSVVRPGTAIIIIVLLATIAIAGVIQLWQLLAPAG